MYIANLILRTFFPQTCISCNKIGSILCNECAKRLYAINLQTCIICKNYSHFGKTHKACKNKWTPNHTLSVYKHTATAKNIIKNAKSKQYTFKAFLTALDFPQSRGIIENLPIYPEITIPIPQSSGPFSKRYKNLSNIFAEKINKIYGSHTIPALYFHKRQKKQKSLNKEQRYLNIQKTLRIKNNSLNLLKNKNILILDDVSTTGATLLYASKLVRTAEPKTITCFTLTKDILDRKAYV